jgi:hypothetical protein
MRLRRRAAIFSFISLISIRTSANYRKPLLIALALPGRLKGPAGIPFRAFAFTATVPNYL